MERINVFVPKFRKKEILEGIEECLDKGWTGMGFKTVEFEEEFKEYSGMSNCHFLNSNTVGLHLAVKILTHANKWKKNDEIITTPLTFVSTNHSILYENLTPILITQASLILTASVINLYCPRYVLIFSFTA